VLRLRQRGEGATRSRTLQVRERWLKWGGFRGGKGVKKNGSASSIPKLGQRGQRARIQVVQGKECFSMYGKTRSLFPLHRNSGGTYTLKGGSKKMSKRVPAWEKEREEGGRRGRVGVRKLQHFGKKRPARTERSTRRHEENVFD